MVLGQKDICPFQKDIQLARLKNAKKVFWYIEFASLGKGVVVLHLERKRGGFLVRHAKWLHV